VIASQILNCKQLCQQLHSPLLQLLSDPKINEIVKPSVARLLSILVFNSYRKQERKEFVNLIVEELPTSKTMTQRKAFLTFCEQSLPEFFTDEGPKIMSKQFFMSNLFPLLIEMQNDRVMSVRRRFCIIAQKVML
jgi:hypothetical protein